MNLEEALKFLRENKKAYIFNSAYPNKYYKLGKNKTLGEYLVYGSFDNYYIFAREDIIPQKLFYLLSKDGWGDTINSNVPFKRKLDIYNSRYVGVVRFLTSQGFELDLYKSKYQLDEENIYLKFKGETIKDEGPVLTPIIELIKQKDSHHVEIIKSIDYEWREGEDTWDGIRTNIPLDIIETLNEISIKLDNLIVSLYDKFEGIV